MATRDELYSDLSRHIADGTANRRIAQVEGSGSTPDVDHRVFRKYVIIDVITDPSDLLENIDAYTERFRALGVTNVKKLASVLPRNSAIGRPLEIDGGGPSIFLLPFFPSHLAMPCKPGELVWVVFDRPEIKNQVHGYWICRVPDFSYVDDVNHSHFPRRWDPSLLVPTSKDQGSGAADPKYEFRNGAVIVDAQGERQTVSSTRAILGPEDVFEKIIAGNSAAKLSVYEAIPRYNKRPHEIALEGSNNTLVVLGTDRHGPVAKFDVGDDGTRVASVPTDDMNHHAGVIDLVAGRGQTPTTAGKSVTNSLSNKELDKALSKVEPNEGDPDFLNDRSRVIISVGTGKFVDKQLNPGLDELHTTVTTMDEATKSTGAVPGAAAIKSDIVRIIARSEVMIVSTNYDVSDGKMVDRTNIDDFASVVLKPNGDIILRPSKKGVIRLGDEEADRAILCSSEPATATDGVVTHSPMISTMGGLLGTEVPNQGTYCTRVLVSAKK